MLVIRNLRVIVFGKARRVNGTYPAQLAQRLGEEPSRPCAKANLSGNGASLGGLAASSAPYSFPKQYWASEVRT